MKDEAVEDGMTSLGWAHRGEKEDSNGATPVPQRWEAWTTLNAPAEAVGR
jgi:hypothetical protein